MDGKELRQSLLNGKKIERVIFAVTPEMKRALSILANDKCTSVSALLTDLATSEVVQNKDLFKNIE